MHIKSFKQFLSEASFAQMMKVYTSKHQGDTYTHDYANVAATQDLLTTYLKKFDRIRKQYPNLSRASAGDISYWLPMPFRDLKTFIDEIESNEDLVKVAKIEVVFQNAHVTISKASNFAGSKTLGKELVKGRQRNVPWCICVDRDIWEEYSAKKDYLFVNPTDTSEESFIVEREGNKTPLGWGLDNDFSFTDTLLPEDQFGMSRPELRKFALIPPLPQTFE